MTGCEDVTIQSMLWALWVKPAVVALAPVIWWVLEAAAFTFFRIPRIYKITKQPSELRQVLRPRPSRAMASCALRARPIEKLNAMFGGCQAELEWRRCASPPVAASAFAAGVAAAAARDAPAALCHAGTSTRRQLAWTALDGCSMQLPTR